MLQPALVVDQALIRRLEDLRPAPHPDPVAQRGVWIELGLVKQPRLATKLVDVTPHVVVVVVHDEHKVPDTFASDSVAMIGPPAAHVMERIRDRILSGPVTEERKKDREMRLGNLWVMCRDTSRRELGLMPGTRDR